MIDVDYLNNFLKPQDIEWLKIIEQGYRISVIKVDNPERGIDTEEDYKYFIEKYNK